MSSFKVFISSSVYVTIDPDTSSVVASPSCLVELNLPFSGLCSQDFLAFSLSPLQEFVVQFKTRKNLRVTLKKTLLFVFGSSKDDNGVKTSLRMTL